MDNSTIEVGIIGFAGVVVSGITAYLVGSRSSSSAAATEREKIASAEIHDAREEWRLKRAELEEDIKVMQLSVVTFRAQAEEADVRASDADARASGLAYQLERCREHLLDQNVLEALDILEQKETP